MFLLDKSSSKDTIYLINMWIYIEENSIGYFPHGVDTQIYARNTNGVNVCGHKIKILNILVLDHHFYHKVWTYLEKSMF